MSSTNEKNILVIGNGFDLYHGFPTRYIHFINFIKNWDSFYSKYKDNNNPRSQNTSTTSKYIKLSSDDINKEIMEELANFYEIYNEDKLKSFDTKIRNNDWIDYFKDICDENKEKGWIDFEKEIEEVIKCIQYILIKSDNPNTDINAPYRYSTILNPSKKYFHRIISSSTGYDKFVITATNCSSSNTEDHKREILKILKQQLDDLIECLNIYLSEFVSKMKPDKQSNDIKNINPDYIISFNYTDIFSTVYKNITTHNIHGKIGDENNMVLGMREIDMNNDIDFVYFYKYFQRIQKRTGVDYNKWLSEGSNNIYILGHSLDSTDKDILEKIITSENTKKVTIFYRNQEEMEKFIINLLKLFLKEDVITYTTEEKIIFEKLEKEQL